MLHVADCDGAMFYVADCDGAMFYVADSDGAMCYVADSDGAMFMLQIVTVPCFMLQILTVPCECQNGGTCVDPVVLGQQYRYNCLCLSGYTGELHIRRSLADTQVSRGTGIA